MANTRLPNTGLQYPATNDTGWASTVDNDFTLLDNLTALGGLCVIKKEDPSTSLNVAVSAGNYRKADGTIGTYAGTASFAITASSTVCLWLTDAGVLTSGGAFPSTAHVRLATVVSGLTTITSVTDARVQCTTSGTGLGFVLKAGDTFTDTSAAAVFHTGTTNGTQLGGASTEKLGFWGTTAVVQQAGSTDILASLVTMGLRGASSNPPLNMGTGALTCGAISAGGDVTIADAHNIVLNTTTGTKIGTATGQKLSFYNATPVVQQLSTTDIATALSNLGLRASGTPPGVFSSMTTAFVTKTSAYTATATDRIIFVDSTTAPVTITLPASVAGKDYIIKDWKGTSATNNITISFTSIDGAATKVISTNYTAVRVVGDGTNYGTV